MSLLSGRRLKLNPMTLIEKGTNGSMTQAEDERYTAFQNHFKAKTGKAKVCKDCRALLGQATKSCPLCGSRKFI